MSLRTRATSGDLVAWWDGNDLALAVSAGEEKRRIRLTLSGGKTVRVPESRIAFVLEGGDPGSPEDAAERVRAAEARIREISGGVDVPLVWELALEEDGPLDLEPLADLALGSAGGPECAAVVRAFLDDRLHFVRKGDAWEPRPRDGVERLQQEREATERRAREKEEALAALGSEGDGVADAEGNPWLGKYLAALEEVALDELGASDGARSLASEALQAAGVRYERIGEGAFRLLRRLGRFSSDDENLQVIRFHLRTEFPDEVLEEAAAAAEHGFSREGREDLTSLEMITIDGEQTTELDDGLTLERTGPAAFRLGIHIADPDAFLEPGGPVDREALARGVTHYMPDRKIRMLPPAIGEQAASLVPDSDRPALSFLVDVDADGAVGESSIARTVVRSSARLSYGEADEAISGGEGTLAGMLRDLDRIARGREAWRLSEGAVCIVAPEVDVRVAGDGAVVLDRMERESASRRLVTETMVLAGELAARFCIDRGLPAIYRRQPPPEQAEEIRGITVDDPVRIRDVRRSLRRGEAGLEPGAHFALGLPAYAQATSPLRRYQDLATHRQIRAALLESEPAFDAEALQRVAATTERADADARRAERDSERYWLLRYLEDAPPGPLEAVVLEDPPRPVVRLEETLLEVPVRSLRSVKAGDRVRLVVVRVNPRADLLTLAPE